MDGLLVLIPLFPLLGVVLIGSAHARLKGIAHIPAITAVALSFAASCGVFFEVLRGHELSVDLFPWIVAGSFRTSIHLVADRLTGIMLLVVTGVSTLIHIYSAGYMHSDPRYPRFFAYLNFFVFSMTMLVLAGDFLLLFVFWEAVGLASYLLIGFWFEKDSAALAGKKAFIVNRIGDFG
ncbi:MAG: NADH-quinone oxidoreductase subunit L, partial [Gemmatimonadetes bacterium]|nr:NADH-quinone oxidoreductase subunit L [Gemmatimonadota bacterium]